MGMGYSQGAGIGQSVMGNAELLYGYYASKRDKKDIANVEKSMPVYTRPEEVKQMLELAKNNAGSRQLPGQGQMEQNIQQAGQSGLRNIQNMSDNPTSSLGAANDIYRSEMNAYNNLAVQQQQYYQANQDRLSQALNESAKYSDMEFEYNKNAPWQRNMQNHINQYVSDRQWMQTGMATWANGVAQFGGGQGNAQASQEPGGQSNNINTNMMQSDAQNGSGMDSMGSGGGMPQMGGDSGSFGGMGGMS
jgi:hypothetical protein